MSVLTKGTPKTTVKIASVRELAHPLGWASCWPRPGIDKSLKINALAIRAPRLRKSLKMNELRNRAPRSRKSLRISELQIYYLFLNFPI